MRERERVGERERGREGGNSFAFFVQSRIRAVRERESERERVSERERESERVSERVRETERERERERER